MRAVSAYAATSADEPLTRTTIQRRDVGPHDVAIDIKFAGICHSDIHTARGEWGQPHFPIVVGHEIAGVVSEVGPEVTRYAVGDRVGVGCMVDSCRECSSCTAGQEQYCKVGFTGTYNAIGRDGQVTQGGYSSAIVVDENYVLRIPDSLPLDAAAPLLCAGVTTYHALRESGVRAGDLVAILGIGGLGHLGVQFAAKMGFRTVAIARGADKKALARKLGAHIYLNSQTQDVAAELNKLGGAKTILATVTSGKAMSSVVAGLATRGRLVVVGVGMDPIQVTPLDLIFGSRTIVGHASGASIDSQDTLAFSALSGVRPTIETMPLERAAEAYDKMMRNEARFRMVLTMGN
jgi:alcohol dehydrogenase (NADP+)